MNKLKKILKSLFVPLSSLNNAIKKQPDRVFFYSNLGFRDNVKAVYDYMIENGLNESFKITVATDECKTFKENAPQNVKFVGLKRGIFTFLKTKYCFYSFGKYPIKPAKEQCVVNLWHGMPLKAIGRLEKGSENEDQNFFTKVIATSPFFADIMCRAFGAGKEQALITPQPRCDEFLKDTPKPEFLSDYDKVVLWLPTFMSSSRLNRTDGYYEEVAPFDVYFLEKLCPVLEEKNILLIIKPHPMDDAVLTRRPFKNILLVTDKELSEKNISIYALLKHSDALITDFSSIYFDYLYFNRPIAFACPDAESYRENRGFVVDDISELMPGYHINSSNDFLAFLQSVSDGQDVYEKQRTECRKLCSSYDGISGCELVLKTIGLLKSED